MKINKMNKFLALSITLIMMISMISGCSSSTTQNTGGDTAQSAEVKTTDFPQKPITLVVPWAAGGSSDLMARSIAQVASKYIDQPIVVENRDGAGGTVAIAELKSKKADGYTIALTASGPMCTQPWMTKVQYDPLKDFASIGGLSIEPVLLAVKSDSPINSVEDLIKAGQSKNLQFGCTGSGSLVHLSVVKFCELEKVQYTHIPFSGGSTAVTALLGGNVDFAAAHLTELLPSYTAGNIKILGIMAEKRNDAIPEVPTFLELGVDCDYGVRKGIIVPAGTPDDVMEILSTMLEKVMDDPDFKKSMDNLKLDTEYTSGDVYMQSVERDYKIFGELITSLNLGQK